MKLKSTNFNTIVAHDMVQELILLVYLYVNTKSSQIIKLIR